MKEIPPIGTWVTNKRAFSGVPRFTEGVVDEHWDGGCTVAWNLPGRPLPDFYREYDGIPSGISGILRDGFTLKEMRFLEITRTAEEAWPAKK